MLSQHSAQRDHNGIPVVSPAPKLIFWNTTSQKREEIEKWNQHNEELLELTTRIVDVLAQTEFMERWFLPLLRPSKNPMALALADESISHICDRSIADELATLAKRLNSAQQRWQEVHDIISAAMVYTMRWIDDRIPEAISGNSVSRPATLIRLWTQESHSPYSDNLGFRCSGWKSCERRPSLTALLHDKAHSLQSLRSHCEKKSQPSVWISCSDSASWMLFYARKYKLLRDPTCRVAIVCMERLERSHIPWGRSDKLVELAGGNPYSGEHRDGVEYASSRHVLVYGTIPAPCLVSILTIQLFLELYRERHIGGLSLNPIHVPFSVCTKFI